MRLFRSKSVTGFVILGLIVLGSFVMLRLYGVYIRPSSCSAVRDSSASPNGTWVVERLDDICDDGRVLGVVLRRPDESSTKKSNYLFAGKLDRPIPEVILLRWIDDAKLLIASPEGKPPETGPSEFRGVRVTYDVYPDDPDIRRNANAQNVVTAPVNFDASFEKKDFAVGLPGVTCTIWLRARDGKFFENVAMRVATTKAFAQKAWVRSGEIRDVPKRKDVTVLFSVDEPVRSPAMKITSAKFDEVYPRANRVFRDFRPINIAARPYPLSQIAYDGYSEDDLARMVMSLRQGMFRLKLRFWLDDLALNYVSATPIADNPVTEFESCVRENGFLNRPLEPASR